MAGNKKISELSTAGTLDGTELVEIIQSSDNVKVTTQDIADLATGGGITGAGTVDYIPKVLTVSSGNIVTVGNSVFQDTTDTASARKTGVDKGVQFDVINGTFYGVNRVLSYITDNGQADLGTTTGTVRTGISAKPNNAYFGTCLNNDFATFDSYIRTDENAELYIMSTSIPITSTGVLTVAADGKIGVGSAGATGTFTSNDGKTITVTDGIITAIV